MSSQTVANPVSATDQLVARTDGRTNERTTHLVKSGQVLNRAQGISTLGESLDLALSRSAGVLVPVNNREPRKAFNKKLRAAIKRRDGGRCWICGIEGASHIDHVVPRSTFYPDRVEWADKSWNLRLACSRCNTQKSRKVYAFQYPLPILDQCVADQWGEDWPGWPREDSFEGFCDRCGMSAWFPNGWLEAVL